MKNSNLSTITNLRRKDIETFFLTYKIKYSNLHLDFIMVKMLEINNNPDIDQFIQIFEKDNQNYEKIEENLDITKEEQNEQIEEE